MSERAVRSVFVVEDDDATRKLVQRQLERAGYAVRSFPNGRDALEAVRAAGCGLVVADWMMPEMDGLQLCAELRKLESLQVVTHLYFILLTAQGAKDQIVRGLEAGANDYLTKPYHVGELLARVSVGARMLNLQDELLKRNLEVHRANAQMAVLAEKLERLANTDALTGLSNRRHLFDRLSEAWSAAAEHHGPISCVMLDVDRFKRVNDTYGHHAGDIVLKAVAEAIQRSIRRSDLCGRFGGEEFAVVCPYHGIEGAAVLAERLRCAVAAEPVVAEGVTINVTISAGVAERQAGQIKPEQMLECADEMLYAAKNNGRNQVWLAVGASEGRPLHGEPAAGTGPPSSAIPPRSDAAPPISGFIVAREQAPA